MRRNGARFALISVGKIGPEALLLRLSTVLRNVVVMCSPLITPDNCWHNTTWPEFQPSLPPGLLQRHQVLQGVHPRVETGRNQTGEHTGNVGTVLRGKEQRVLALPDEEL